MKVLKEVNKQKREREKKNAARIGQKGWEE